MGKSSDWGFVKKHRSFSKTFIAHSPPVVRETWDWLLMNAAWEKTEFKGYPLERGEVFCSRKDIMEGLHWINGAVKMTYSEKQIKGAMQVLKQGLMVESRKVPRGSVVSICNYDKYQAKVDCVGTDAGTNGRALVGRQQGPSITKEVKELKKKDIRDNFDFKEWPSVPTEKLIDELVAHKKAAKAVKLNQRIIDSIGKELKTLSGHGLSMDYSLGILFQSSWKGFKASWILNDTGKTTNQPQSLSIDMDQGL